LSDFGGTIPSFANSASVSRFFARASRLARLRASRFFFS